MRLFFFRECAIGKCYFWSSPFFLNFQLSFMILTTKAIVFSAIKYGEADLIVKCFTEKAGLKSYLLRGILKSKKGKLKVSLFQVLTQLEIVAQHKDQGKLEYIRDAKVISPYRSLHTNVVKSTVVIFLAEVLRNAVKEEEANPRLFQYLEDTLHWFDNHEKIANFHLLFLLNLTRHLGFYPDEPQDDKPVFNLLDGTFQQVKTSNECISDENVDVLKQLLGIDFEALPEIKLNQTSRSNFLLMLLNYYEIHLQGFHKPKSLAVLNEIYS